MASAIGAVASAGNAIGGIAGTAGDIMEKQSTADLKKSQMEKEEKLAQDRLAFEKSTFNATGTAQNKVYEDALKNMQSGEAGMNAVQGENSYLNDVTEGIRSGTNEDIASATGALKTNLATAGVRGGQNATLLNRGVGQMGIDAMKNINQLKYQDEATKQAQINAYNQAKALLAQNKAVAGAKL